MAVAAGAVRATVGRVPFAGPIVTAVTAQVVSDELRKVKIIDSHDTKDDETSTSTPAPSQGAEANKMDESMFKSAITYYTLETKSTLLGLYNKDKLYTVRRRFNDFKRLYSALRTVDEYKGFSIPPLPEDATSITSYVVHSDSFIKERR